MNRDPSQPVDPGLELARDRTVMAAYGTALALDRTTLAWVRTTLGMASFGFGMVAFFRTLAEHAPSAEALRLQQGAIRMGTALILLGISSMILAGFSHWATLRKLRRGTPPDLGPWSPALTVAIFSAVLALAGLWELFVR